MQMHCSLSSIVITLSRWYPLFERLGRALQNDTWKEVRNTTEGEKKTYHLLKFLSILLIYSERAARKYSSFRGLIVHHFHGYIHRNIGWYACGYLSLIFRESASVQHTFHEKLSDKDLLLIRVPVKEPISLWMFNNCLKASGRKLNVLCA